ncbi:MAG: Wzz/FepE/Etk N-terminal domain-containing protein [Pseudomonadota bacterium]
MSDTERPIDIRDYIDAVLRRWLLFVIFVPLFGLGGLFVAYVLPPVYEAKARILVESQAISGDLVTSTVTANAAERLRVIEQRLLTRRNLLQVIEDLNLFADDQTLTPTAKVAQLRAGTKIDPILGGTRRDVTAFVISFRSGNAGQAAAVVNEFVSLVLEQNVIERTQLAAQTKDFFAVKAEEIAAQLQDLETEISAFKRANAMALPQGIQYRQSELTQLQEAMFQREREMLQLEEQRRELQALLDQGIDIDSVLDQLSEEPREIRKLEQQLLIYRAGFAESHPQVKSLIARIAALEASIGPNDRDKAERLVAERRGKIERELALIANRRALLEKQQSNSLEKQTQLRLAIEKAPAVEMELRGMERGAEQLRRQYQDTLGKLAVAETGEKLEVNQQAERFEVIEQAEPPNSPVAPNRRLIAASGFAGGVATAFALIVFAELMNQSVRTASDLERTLNLRPVVTIPYIETEQEVRRRIWRIRVAVILLLIVAPTSLWLIDQFVMPLVQIADRLMERTGLQRFLDIVRDRLAS